MNDFTYYAPTKVIFGKDSDNQVGKMLKEYGAKKVLVFYGGGSVKRSGLFDKVTSTLTAEGISFIEVGGVEPNPKVDFVRENIKLVEKENIDFILAIGGGSAIDTAKSVAISYASGTDPWDVVMGKVVPTKRLPFAVVLTIAAAGSEMSNSHVISDPKLQLKKGLSSDLNRPVFAFLNPENTFSVSKYQTGCGIVDTMMHTFERYYTEDVDTDLTDHLAEALILSVKDAGAIAIKEPDNYAARADLMWASSLSHNGLTGCGKNIPTFTVHQLSHGVSGVFDNVAHGAALSVLYPAWAKYVYKYNLNRFCQMATRVWGVSMNYNHPEITALEGVEAMKAYFKSLGMPVTMAELGITPDDYDKIADSVTFGGTRKIWSYVTLDKKEIIDIFKLAE